jgi:hypothetical protein
VRQFLRKIDDLSEILTRKNWLKTSTELEFKWGIVGNPGATVSNIQFKLIVLLVTRSVFEVFLNMK